MNAAGDLTLADLMLQLSIRTGTRDWTASEVTIPDDGATRQLLKNAINRGRRELYSRLPEARVFEPTIEILMDATGTAANVVGGDPSKYRIPYAVEGFAGGQFEWGTPSADGTENTGWSGIIRQCHQSDVTALHTSTATGSLLSFPRCVALSRQTLSNPSDPGRKVIDFLWVYPKPDQAYIIKGQVRVTYGDLVELDDLEPMGQQHLESVLVFAERAWKTGQCDEGEWALLQNRCEQAVLTSTALDNARGPQNLGAGFDPDAEVDRLKYRPTRAVPDRWAMVSEVSGQSVL